MGYMGSKRSQVCVFHPSSCKGVFTRDLDMRCNQETNLAIELSHQADSDDMSWAIVESKHQALNDEMMAEALAWSYERPNPRRNLVDRLRLDLSKKGSEGNSTACWSPTLLTQRPALLAKLDRGNRVFDQASSHSVEFGGEALRLPVGMRSACLPGERGRPRKVSSIRRKPQQTTMLTEHNNKCWRSFVRATMVAKVAAISGMNRPLVGKDWTPIILSQNAASIS